MRDANTVARRFAGEFEQANAAYVAYSRGELRPARARTDLTAAAAAIRTARGDVADLEPSLDAQSLHEKYLRYLDMNVGFAEQTLRLAVYTPGAARALQPLDRVNRRLDRQLPAATEPGEQADALRRFTRSLDGMLADLRGLAVPAVLRPTHPGPDPAARAVPARSPGSLPRRPDRPGQRLPRRAAAQALPRRRRRLPTGSRRLAAKAIRAMSGATRRSATPTPTCSASSRGSTGSSARRWPGSRREVLAREARAAASASSPIVGFFSHGPSYPTNRARAAPSPPSRARRGPTTSNRAASFTAAVRRSPVPLATRSAPLPVVLTACH